MGVDEYEQLFDDVAAPDDLVEAAKERGWADGMVARMLRLRFRRELIETWLGPDGPSAEDAAAWLSDRERITLATLRCRPVIRQADGDGLSALWDDAPENVGEWEVTVQRSPNGAVAAAPEQLGRSRGQDARSGTVLVHPLAELRRRQVDGSRPRGRVPKRAIT